jgi:hypothetical protein
MKRDFRLKDLPRDPEGNVLYTDSSEESYDKYLDWLAHYLSTSILPPDVETNSEWSRFHTGNPHNLAGSLAIHAAFREIEVLQAWVEQQVIDGERDEEDLEFQFSDLELTELLAEDKEEFEVFGEFCDYFADIGWRIPLAILIRRVNSKAEQILILREFFRSFTEESGK